MRYEGPMGECPEYVRREESLRKRASTFPEALPAERGEMPSLDPDTSIRERHQEWRITWGEPFPSSSDIWWKKLARRIIGWGLAILGVWFFGWIISILSGPSPTDDLKAIIELWNEYPAPSELAQMEKTTDKVFSEAMKWEKRLEQEASGAIGTYYGAELYFSYLKSLLNTLRSPELQKAVEELSERLSNLKSELENLKLETEEGEKVRQAALSYLDAGESMGEAIKNWQECVNRAANVVLPMTLSQVQQAAGREELVRAFNDVSLAEEEVQKYLGLEKEKWHSFCQTVKEVAEKEGLTYEEDEARQVIKVSGW